MYQIIYIDIDEEITAVIDKLRKSKTAQVFLAIPKRALILQSIVSLKLLSREAEKLEKNIIIATQDPREQKMAEKAGIEIRASLEGLDTEGEMRESVVPKIQEENSLNKKASALNSRSRKNVEEIGTEGFYDLPVSATAAVSKSSQKTSWTSETDAPKRVMSEISREERKPKSQEKETFFAYPSSEDKSEVKNINTNFTESHEKEEMLKSFFQADSAGFGPVKNPKEEPETIHPPVSGRIKKAIIVILVAGILVAGSAAAYLFVPKAEVQIKMRTKTAEKDLDLRADANLEKINVADSIIPARITEKEEIYSFSYPVTGKGQSQGQKAKGTLVIYNEFSSSPQVLVATTRFETFDKKIFRLVKGVTVPGMSEVDGKKQPGAIEAEVIADASGENYNIDPAVFTIPGFAGSPKFEKFSAKSTEKMKGGNSSKNEGSAGALTAADIAMAKGKSETQAKEKIKEDMKKSLTEGEFLPESAFESSIVESGALSKIGDLTGEFQYRVKINSKALVFSDSDVKAIFENYFRTDDRSSISLDYGAVSVDFGNGTAAIKVHGKMAQSAEVDVEKLKGDLAGKSGAEIEEVIKNYPQISEIEINVIPAFLFEKVPQMVGRIDVIID